MHWGAFASYLLATQRSISLFHGCQQCLLTSVLHLATLSCFRRQYYILNSRGKGMHHSLLSLGTEDFTHFHLHKKWIPRSSRMGEGRGCGGFKWLVHYHRSTIPIYHTASSQGYHPWLCHVPAIVFIIIIFFLYNNGVFQALAGVVKVFAYIQCRSSPIYC